MRDSLLPAAKRIKLRGKDSGIVSWAAAIVIKRQEKPLLQQDFSEIIEKRLLQMMAKLIAIKLLREVMDAICPAACTIDLHHQASSTNGGVAVE